jgi:transmembrane sensor
MTVYDQNGTSERLEREAHGWVARLVSGDATAADGEALKCWRELNPAHEAAFVAAARRWKDFGPAGRRLLAQGDVPVWAPPSPAMTRRAILGGAGALAASAVGYAVVQPPLGLWPSITELGADYRTATGEQRRITVADNVSVRMNTQTSIAISSSTDDTDHIKLIAGEASFTTSPASRKSLVVLAADGRTMASQAQFDVRNIGSTVCVTCFEGGIRIEQGTQVATIGPKRQIRYDGSGLRPVVAIDPAEFAAWQDGVLIFRLTPLSEVVAEINRYRRGKVILMNAKLASNQVNGRFRIQRIDEVLVWIEQAFGASSRSLPGGIVLLS